MSALDIPVSPALRGKSAELESIIHKPNYAKIWLFLIVVTSFNMNASYIGSDLTQMKKLIQVKLDWVPGSSSESLNYTFLSTINNVGACVGALYGKKLISYGRRKSLFVIGYIFLLSAVVTQYMNFWAILIARLIGGVAAGLTTVAVSRIIEEYVPLAMYATASPLNALVGNLGTFIALFSAVVLPSTKAEDLEYEESVAWRYIFGFSLLFTIIGLLGLIFLVRTDTPKFYLSKGEEEESLIAIKTIYNTEGS